MTEQTFEIDLLRKYEYKLIWNFSKRCNYACPYCYNFPEQEKNSKEITERYSAEQIAESFDRTGVSWLILFSGGEPFLVPDFLPLLKALSQKHHLQITTNLCSDDLYRLHDFVLPDKVMAISASLHAEEREKEDPGFSEFIKKCLFLEQKGFRVLVNYVTWPPLFSRMEKDFESLRSKGISDLTVLTFRGTWNEKYYPGSYTDQQIEIIGKLAIDKAETDIAKRNTNYKGRPCEAGHNFFSMNVDGDITRCGTIQTPQGNLFKNTFRMNRKDLPCTAEECIDCYLGMVSLKERTSITNRIKNLFTASD